MIKYTLLLLLLISPAISLQAKEIKIGIFDFAPWGMQVADRVTGIVWQQALAIFKQTEFTPVAHFSSYSRMFKQLEAGQIDCSLMIKSMQNSDSLNVISYLYDLKASVISRKGIKINNFADFYNPQLKVIGFARGTNFLFPKLFNDPKVKLHIVPSQHQGPLMIARGRIDAFVGMTETLLYELRQENLLDQMNFPGYPVSQFPVWLQCSKRSLLSAMDLAAIKQAADKVRAKDTFTTIIEQWIAPIQD
ncbi:MAG: transporter substrate-binding domain-containing protein [Oceanospirillaceae bacterium]|nr:transporter substrate-binding domain-containing protein [Oceanospirillaceae bacterium]